MLLLALVAVLATPTTAHAYYDETADSFPAMQDMGLGTDVLYGSDIPDGVYEVIARTSSRMCIPYSDYNDAVSRSGPGRERAILEVQGGSMTVVFYLSSAYTRIYFGTQDEAAAQSVEGGDSEAFIAGDPRDGYEPHLYSFGISALNDPMVMSTYSGGDKGWEQGRWYTRQIAFIPTDDIYMAIESAQQDDGDNQDPGNSDPSETPGNEDNPDDPSNGEPQNGNGGQDGGDTAPENGDNGGEQVSGGDVDPSDDGPSQDDEGNDQQNADNEDSSDDEPSDESSDEEGASEPEEADQDNQDSESEEAAASAEGEDGADGSTGTGKPATMIGVRMNMVGMESPANTPDRPSTPLANSEANSNRVSSHVFVALFILALLAVGAAWRGVAFKWAFTHR